MGREVCTELKIDWIETKFAARKIITLHNISNMCAKEFSDLHFDLAVIDKIMIFQDIAPKFQIFKKIVIFKYNWIFFRLTANFMVATCWKYTF